MLLLKVVLVRNVPNILSGEGGGEMVTFSGGCCRYVEYRPASEQFVVKRLAAAVGRGPQCKVRLTSSPFLLVAKCMHL